MDFPDFPRLPIHGWEVFHLRPQSAGLATLALGATQIRKRARVRERRIRSIAIFYPMFAIAPAVRRDVVSNFWGIAEASAGAASETLWLRWRKGFATEWRGSTAKRKR